MLTPLEAFGGWQLYENRDRLVPQIEVLMNEVVGDARNTIATVSAPTPPPTEDPGQRLASASSAWARGAIEDAVTTYSGLLEAVPNEVGPHYLATLGMLMNGDLGNALTMAERTITANPYSADAWAIRSMALNWNRRPGEAIASALHALDLAGPEDAMTRARALAFLAEAYLDSGQYERALNTADQALDLYPDSFEAHRARSRIMQEWRFDFAAALQDAQIAHELAPNLPYLTIDLALLELRDGETDVAIEMLRDLIELNPRNVRGLYWLGYIYWQTIGDPNQAADYLSRCVGAAPDSINCHYLLGRSQFRLESYNLALESFETALRLGSTDPYHYWWMGRTHAVLGNCPAAVPFLQDGWEIARQRTDEILISSYLDQMRSCNMFIEGVPDEVEEEPEATDEAPADDS